MENKSVYIIILNYNHKDDLDETIRSFIAQDYPNYKLIVSDNASTDNSIKWLKSTYPDIVILENKENLGWSGGNNIAVKYALEQGADYILLANNDLSISDSSVITRMVIDLERFKYDKIFLLGTRVNYYFDKNKTHNTGWIMYPKEEEKGHYFNSFRKNCSIEMETNYQLVDSVDGCFIMIDATVFKQIGLFKEELFMYGDEIDFSLRAWATGYKSVINTNLTIFHKVGTSSIPKSPFSEYYRTRNLLFLIKSNNKSRYIFLYCKDVLKALMRNIFRMNTTIHQKIRINNAILGGIIDALFNRVGKRY